MNKRERGFTLIELLVVIAIIGILSSVVLASLNTARDKGANAAAKANLNNARAQAELFYDGNTTGYSNVCADAGGIAGLVAAATSSAGWSATIAEACFASSTAWGAEVVLKGDAGVYCVDSTGFAGEISAQSIGANDAVCN
jgi:type IV pilus assembly protein PilA